MSALSKVQKCVSMPANGSRPSFKQDLGEFLKTHMLGILSNMNDMLQDIPGKATVEAKQQILRSLGALVSNIGPCITSVAPQVIVSSFRFDAVLMLNALHRSWPPCE